MRKEEEWIPGFCPRWIFLFILFALSARRGVDSERLFFPFCVWCSLPVSPRTKKKSPRIGKISFSFRPSLSIRPSYGAREEEILDGGGGRGRRERTSLPFSLPFFPFSPETPDTQATLDQYLITQWQEFPSSARLQLLELVAFPAMCNGSPYPGTYSEPAHGILKPVESYNRWSPSLPVLRVTQPHFSARPARFHRFGSHGQCVYPSRIGHRNAPWTIDLNKNIKMW